MVEMKDVVKMLILSAMSFSAGTAIVAWILRIIQVLSGETDESKGKFGKYCRTMVAITILSFGLAAFLIWIYSLILKR